MAEVGAIDLDFTREETLQFLKGVMDLDPSTEDVVKLEGRTEGWIAGLQLAALSMRDREGVSGFVEIFSRSHRDVLDFLVEEVLEGQPEEVRGFLLSTSVLERMSAPLCDALTEGDDGQRMLEDLERENLFVVPLDDERGWYRYHHLFADFLRGRLWRDDPERVEGLHRVAASWCEHHGLIDDALRHALAAGDVKWVARLVDRHIASVLPRGEGATVDCWLTALPPELIHSQPRLCLARAVRAMVSGRLDDFEQRLLDAEHALTAARDDADEPEGTAHPGTSWLANLPRLLAVLRTDLARLSGDAGRTFALARRALSVLDEDDQFLYPVADSNLAKAHWLRGELAEAERSLADLVAAWREADDHYFALLNGWYLGMMHSAQGRLSAAADTYRRGLEIDTKTGSPLPPVLGIAHVGLAEIMRERDDLGAALHYATEGITLCEQLTHRQPLAAGLAALACIRQARGEGEVALEAMGAAEKVGLSPRVVDLFNPVPVGGTHPCQHVRHLLLRNPRP